MGSIYRSEPMTLCQIFFQAESSYQCVAEVGELGLAHFIDLNHDKNAFQREYVREVRRCDEMDRKLRFIEAEIESDDIQIPEYSEHVPAPLPKQMVEMEGNFEKLYAELEQIKMNSRTLKSNYTQLLEMKAVLEKVAAFLDPNQRRDAAQSISEAARGEAGPITLGMRSDVDRERRDDTELKFVAGVIHRQKVVAFERFLWRMCRGKVFARTMDIEDSIDIDTFSSDYTQKAVFLLFFSGEQLLSRVHKICAGFHATIYHCPDSSVERAKLRRQINLQLDDMRTVIRQTLDYRGKIIVTAALNLRKWSIMLLKLKSIFHTMNMFSVDVTQRCLIAECWVPTTDIGRVRIALQDGTTNSGSQVPAILNEMETDKYPPTCFKTNKFTQGFQNIVDAYGIANYREVNPAPWIIISFPFLFAVMFGDAGHGIIMLLASAALVIFEKKLISMKIKDEIFNTFFSGRYVILLMGIFAIYTGFIYNDFYSKSINIFGSSWVNPYNASLLAKLEESAPADFKLTFPPKNAFLHDYGPYPFGVDPVWNIANNKLTFLNGLKMKTSVILGIAQMTFGLVLSLLNHWHNRSFVDVVFVFFPQCVFLGCIFVYLCVQIVIKWIFFWVNPTYIFGQLYPGSNCAPSLLIGLINMFMTIMITRKPGFVTDINNGNGTEYVMINGKNVTYTPNEQCYIQEWYPHQVFIERILLIAAVVSVPVMLFVKPFYIRWRHSKGLPIDHGHGPQEGHGEFSFGDVMVHQAIHTIEFVLGCVSHTASYLRLWALSLAHAQLSEVLWTMILDKGLKMSGYVGAVAIYFVFYYVFAILSICILILMEGLSAFLHAIRLHWVEFQSKFYGGAGYAFEPFSFERIIRVHEGLEQ